MNGRLVFLFLLFSTQQACVFMLSSQLQVLRNSLKDALVNLDAFAEHETVVETEVLSGLGRPSSCAELLLSGHTESGVYTIFPRLWFKTAPFHVYCDMETDGGGWTVFQRRDDYEEPREDFFRTWTDYKNGFGNLTKEFWLEFSLPQQSFLDTWVIKSFQLGKDTLPFGSQRVLESRNEHLFVLTNQDHVSLRVDLQDFEGGQRYATYGQFQVADKDDDFRVRIGKYKGDAGDNLGFDNAVFVARDKNDVNQCSANYKGGWWYTKCHAANLNGLYLMGNHTTYANGINWHAWRGHHYSLKKSEMKVRPVHFLMCNDRIITPS